MKLGMRGPEYVKFQVYCSTHIESVYQNTKEKTNAEIAESYGCQIGAGSGGWVFVNGTIVNF
jgi:hypothetical protein